MRNLLKYIFIPALSVALAACTQKDGEPFLKRDTDEMTFTYMGTTKELSVFTNGEWTVTTDDSWISLDPGAGSGNGSDRQRVKVTVDHNKGAVRDGKLKLSGNGKTYDIKVIQNAGFFSWEGALINGTMVVHKPVSSRISVSYNKGAGDDYADISVTLTGPGAAGLSVTPLTNYKLDAGDGTITLNMSGTPISTGEVVALVEVKLTTRSITENLTAKARVKASEEDIDPLPSPTVTAFKLLPRLAVFDWGKYVKGSGVSRKFTLELSKTQYGAAIRHYSAQADWLSSASIGTGNYFYENNRFAFGDLEPGQTYWFRIMHHTNNPAQNSNSDMTYFEFTTPAEPAAGPDLLLYKDFDNHWWGGCPIYQAFAVMPLEAQIKADLDPASNIVKATDYRTHYPVGNIATPFGTALNAVNCPALWKYCWDGDTYGYDISAGDYAGWMGANTFPCTGSVRLATASAQGWLRTPKLAAIGEGTANITVTVNTAPYFEAYHSWGEDYLEHFIIVSGGGTITSGGGTLVSIEESDTQARVRCNSNVDSNDNGPSGTHAATTEHTIKIVGATKDTQITVKTCPYSGAAHYRIWLDDIRIVKD